jgi:hypothetical protein
MASVYGNEVHANNKEHFENGHTFKYFLPSMSFCIWKEINVI